MFSHFRILLISTIISTFGFSNVFISEYCEGGGYNKYVEIYIDADIKKLVKRKSKYFYRKKVKNVVGISIKPEFPKKPNFLIKNNFNKTVSKLSKELVSKINEKFNS